MAIFGGNRLPQATTDELLRQVPIGGAQAITPQGMGQNMGQMGQEIAANAPQMKKPGFLAYGGLGRSLLGGLADAIARHYGGPEGFREGSMLERQMRQSQMDRQNQLQDAMLLAGYKAKLNPQQPHYWESNDGSLMAVGPDGKPQKLYQDPTPKINWVRADNGDGTFTMVPVPLTGQGQFPSAPVGNLTPLP